MIRRAMLLALACVVGAACSSSSGSSGSGNTPAPPGGRAVTTTSVGRVAGPGVSQDEAATAMRAVTTNWGRCLAAVNVSSDTATVAAIDDSSTGRPIDKGNHPVVVHVKWGAKSAAFLVDLKGRLTGAALYGPTATAMIAAAKQVGAGC